jgi:hypothetical protein
MHAAPRWLRHALRALAVIMGAVHSTVAVLQQSMNEDGINYLDMGDAYLSGDWGEAFSAVWSPVYGVLISAAVRISDASIWWEFPAVQIANFAIYVGALLSFEFFWNRLTAQYYAGSGHDAVRFPPFAWHAMGYSLFIWSSLNLIQIWSVTPDMCVAAVVYLAAGLILQASGRPAQIRTVIVLGLLLGFGYLVKAALLPLGLVALLLTAMATAAPLGRRVRGLVASIAAMLVIAAPLIAPLSWNAGHLTMGDVGRFTYLKHVNEMPYPDFHSAVDRLRGAPLHPPRRVFDEPPVYEFAEPVAGTYPMAFDPGYWTRGLAPVISAEGQARALATSAMFLFDLFVRMQGGFLALILLLAFMSDRRRLSVDGTAALVLWSLAAFGMYSIVHILSRYIAPFVVLFWAGILAGMRFPADASGKRLASVGSILLTLFVWINLGALNLDGLRRVTGFTPLSEAASQPATEIAGHRVSHPLTAEELLRLGLQGGDAVGVIGYSYSEYWARLARFRIIAEIHWHDTGRFWDATPEKQAGAIEAFAKAGAVAVIADPVSIDQSPPGWRPVGDTGYLIYMLSSR